jgi:hypothetical protein
MAWILKFKSIAILISTLIGLANAQKTDIEGAKNLLNALYNSTIFSNKILDYGNKKETSKYFNADIVELLYLEDKCKIKTQSICNLNWDFLCACQDYTNNFFVKFEVKPAKSIQVIVKITDNEYKQEILFSFVNENGKWKISNVEIDDWSLKKALSNQ